MATSTTTNSIQPPAAHWSLPTRIAFRFCFAYLGLYSLSTQIVLAGLLLPAGSDLPDPATLPPMRQIVIWTALHLFRLKPPIIYVDNGSGDKIFNWVLAFCLLVVASLVTGTWSVLDRQRKDYAALHKWFRLFVRFGLAGQMIGYGMAKVIPTQMPFPSLARLLEPYGNFSPMGVLWNAIGASPAYEVFAGCAEVLGGILLVIPRTTVLGTLIALADTVQVFTLNMSYDVPVKLFSFHLILMSLFLLALDLPRLAGFFFLNRSTAASSDHLLFSEPRSNRVALALQILFGIWLLMANTYWSWHGWHAWSSGRPKSPLYGVWNVEQFAVDGRLRAPLVTDNARWRRVVFDFPDAVIVQLMDDSFAGDPHPDYLALSYTALIDVKGKTVALAKGNDKNWKASFKYDRPAQDRLVLDGQMDGHQIEMQLTLLDRSKFLLINRGFHWINEFSFNR
jgi:hypothetical protein